MRLSMVLVVVGVAASFQTISTVKAAESQIGLKVIAATGRPAPGAPGATYSSLDAYTLNAAGDVAFTAQLAGNVQPFLSDRAIYRASSGADPELVARWGNPSPIEHAAYYRNSTELHLNSSGQMAFGTGVLHTSGPNAGRQEDVIFIGSSHLTPVLRAVRGATPTPGLGPDAFFSFGQDLNDRPLLLHNDAGDLAFLGKTHTSGAAIFRWRDGNLETVARQGQSLEGVRLDNLSLQPRINVAGEIIFSDGNASLWLATPGQSSRLIARRGTPSPDGATFGSIQPRHTINAAGDVAFLASLLSRDVVFAGVPGALVAVAESGEPADGVAGAAYSRLTAPALNNHRQVA
jgi:hypothetical protein